MIQIYPYDSKPAPALMALLLEADPDERAIGGYLDRAQIFVAEDSGRLVGVAVLYSGADGFELKNIAVAESHRGRGLAKRLIQQVKDAAKSQGARSLTVGTGNSSLSQLALYQKCGFRISAVKKDFFASYPEPIYENGIRCLDMLVLTADLS